MNPLPPSLPSTMLPVSRAQVAKRLGVSERTVARIERVALLKLRHGLEQRGITAATVRAILFPASES